jgi:hypothetical protein
VWKDVAPTKWLFLVTARDLNSFGFSFVDTISTKLWNLTHWSILFNHGGLHVLFLFCDRKTSEKH